MCAQIYPYSFGSDITIPFYQSSLGYGFLWNHPGYGTCSLTDAALVWTANATQQIDIWITTSAQASSFSIRSLI